MSSAAESVPAEEDMLCENCGYTLNGLPSDGRCPECGKPVSMSQGTERQASSWETHPDIKSFITTTSALIFQTRHFFRHTTTRGPLTPARRFALIHWGFISIFLAITAYLHSDWYFMHLLYTRSGHLPLWIIPLHVAWIYPVMANLTRVAAKLTEWESRYRGYRLPLPVVRRALYYHAAHFLPVTLLSFATVFGYTQYGSKRYADDYLYVLSGEVVLCAAYLFETYWVAMRNMMYANR